MRSFLGLVREKLDVFKDMALDLKEVVNRTGVDEERLFAFAKVCVSSFEQYCILEEDFLNILRYIPLEEESFNVYSPRFTDIIIRCGCGVDNFLREWVKLEFSGDKKIKKEIAAAEKGHIRFEDYRLLLCDKYHLNINGVRVRELFKCITPFSGWEKSKVPDWWSAYTNVKHKGLDSIRKHSNLKNALMSIGAWAVVLGKNLVSASYLGYLFGGSMSKGSIHTVSGIQFNITLPLDCRRYLFSFHDGYVFDDDLYACYVDRCEDNTE